MTKDEIIRMAREAGFYGGEISSAEESFVHFAALVAAAAQGADKRDAERYRWLREFGAQAAIYFPIYNRGTMSMPIVQTEELDNAIDNAIRERKEK